MQSRFSQNIFILIQICLFLTKTHARIIDTIHIKRSNTAFWRQGDCEGLLLQIRTAYRCTNGESFFLTTETCIMQPSLMAIGDAQRGHLLVTPLLRKHI